MRQGQIIILYGASSTGKSTISKALLAHLQSQGDHHWQSENISTQILRFYKYHIFKSSPQNKTHWDILSKKLTSSQIYFTVTNKKIVGPSHFSLPLSSEKNGLRTVDEIFEVLPQSLKYIYTPDNLYRLRVLIETNPNLKQLYPIKHIDKKMIFSALFDRAITQTSMGISTILEIIPFNQFDPLEIFEEIKQKLHFQQKTPKIWIHASFEEIKNNLEKRNQEASQAISQHEKRSLETAKRQYDVIQTKARFQNFDLHIINNKQSSISQLAIKIYNTFIL